MATVTRVSISLPTALAKELRKKRQKAGAGFSFNLSNLVTKLLQEHLSKNGKAVSG